MNNKQAEYENFVKEYFEEVGIKMPEGMNILLTDDPDDRDYYEVEYKKKDGDNWIKSGYSNSEKIYFVGRSDIGFAIDVKKLDKVIGHDAVTFPLVERDDKGYFKLSKAYAIRWAVLITYFRRITKQPELEKIYGTP